MKKLFISLIAIICVADFSYAQNKLITRAGRATIFSHTVAEDIRASNNDVTGMINFASGEVAISVPVQSFQFEKALMQEHFNSMHFMDSKQYPRITFKGKIEKADAINFSANGKYEVNVNGDLTIKGVSKPVSSKATIEVSNGKITVSNEFLVKDISSYGVGKPMGSKKNNVADDIQVSYNAVYEASNE